MEDVIDVYEENVEDIIDIQNENVYYIPTGEIEITENGTHNVSKYVTANVNVQPSKDVIKITDNGTYDVADYKQANVQTPGYQMSDIYANLTNDNHDLYWQNSMLKIPPVIQVDGATNISYAFNGCDVLNEITLNFTNCNESVNITGLFSASDIKNAILTADELTYSGSNHPTTFGTATDLKISNVKASKAGTTASYTYEGLNNNSLINIEIGDFLNEVVDIGRIRTMINLDDAINLTEQSLVNIINSLGTSSDSRTNILNLGDTNIAKLSEEELQIITDKGWTYQ